MPADRTTARRRPSATSRGFSAPTPAIRPRASRTASIAPISPRARPACRSPSTCRPRPATTATTARARRSRQGRRRDLPYRRHAGAVRGHPARRDEHVDDDQRHRALADGALYRGRRRTGRAARRPAGHDAERHHQGISVARLLCFPARPVAAADQGPHPVLRPRDAEVEPDERLLLPSAGGGRDAGAGAQLRAGDRDRRARHGARIRARSTPTASPTSSAASRSSSTPACASSPNSPRCAPSSSCGTRSRASATA